MRLGLRVGSCVGGRLLRGPLRCERSRDRVARRGYAPHHLRMETEPRHKASGDPRRSLAGGEPCRLLRAAQRTRARIGRRGAVLLVALKARLVEELVAARRLKWRQVAAAAHPRPELDRLEADAAHH